MTSPQETGKSIENATEKLLYEFNTTGGVFRIYEREGGEKYAFELEKSLRSSHGLKLVSTMIGKFLCNLDDETGELARQIFEARDEYLKASFEDRGEIDQKMNRLGEQLLPHLVSRGELGGFDFPHDAIHVINSYSSHKITEPLLSQQEGYTIEPLFATPEEEAQFNSLGEF